MFFRRILLMSTLAFSAASLPASPMPDATNSTIELDGSRARALAAAFDAFQAKVPDARIESYLVHVHAAADGIIEIVFEPRFAPGEKPTLGGRTAAGPEVNVRVKSADYSIDGVSFAR